MASDVRRRAGVGEHPTNENSLDRTGDDHHAHQKHLLHDHHYLSVKELTLIIPYLAFLAFIVWCAHTHLPAPKAADIEPSTFSARRAREYLNGITSVGEHPCGSYENDVLTVNYILKTIDRIKATALPHYEIDVDVQRPTGGFILHFLWGAFTNTYNNVTNIVVHLYPKGARPEHNIMVNAHFDSQFKTEGASDDAVSCALMLEIMSCLARSNEGQMKHGVIFLFNGAEEAMLEGGHGFVSQHPWVKNIRAFVNLEAAGSGGRELVFQTGPGHPWLIQTYAKSAVYPYASIVAQEVFQSGVIPSDTDFRIFRDFGNLPGIDIAYSSNGYVYHTKYDKADSIPDGSLQRAGENVLGVLHSLVLSPYVADTHQYKHGKIVFFDILGWQMVLYPWRLGIILNLSLVLVALLYIARQVVMRDLAHKKGADNLEHGRATAFLVTACFFVSIIAIAAGFLVSLSLAFFLSKIGKSLSWYSCPPFALALYGLPFLTTLIAVHSGAKKLLPKCYKHTTAVGHRQLERSCVYSHMILVSCGLVLLTYKGILSSFFLTLWLGFTFFGHCLLYDQILYTKGLVWSSVSLMTCHVIGHFVPAALSGYNLYAVYDVFVPIFGRLGSEVKTDIVLSFVSCFTVTILTLFMVSLVYLLKSSKKLLLFLVGMSVIPSILVVTNVIFPYSGKNPLTPKRIIFQHMHRKFHDKSGNVVQSDSGVWVVPMDILGLSDLKKMPILKDAKLVHCKGVYCGLPYYYPMRFMIRKTWLLPAPPPPIEDWPQLNVVNREHLDDRHVRIHFMVEGPNHMNLFIDPREHVRITEWSLTEQKPESQSDHNGGECYFIFHTHGYYASPWKFWIDFQHDGLPSNSTLAEIALAGQYINGKASTSDTLNQITQQLPAWAVEACWISSFSSWII